MSQNDGSRAAAKIAMWCHELCLANRRLIGAPEDISVLRSEPAAAEPEPEAKKGRRVTVKGAAKEKEKRESDGDDGDDEMLALFAHDDGLVLFDEDELPGVGVRSAASGEEGAAVDADKDEEEGAVKRGNDEELEEEDDLNAEYADSYNCGSEDSRSESAAAGEDDW
jgi:hypothetical protein